MTTNAESYQRHQAFQSRAGTDRDHAVACLVLNLVVLPGLGTILAKRVISGVLQMVLALVGLVLASVWLYKWIGAYLALFRDGVGSGFPPWHTALIALGFLVVSWLWSAVSGIIFLRKARGHAPVPAAPVPPGGGVPNVGSGQVGENGARLR